MDILLLILIAVILYGTRVSFQGHTDYINRAQTDSIKGIFAVIILYSHMKGYLIAPGEHDKLFYVAIDAIGQLMVVMFLLYSGYGVMESLKRNRKRYYDTFLTHRVLKIWLMFLIAVTLFLLLSIALGQEYTTEQYIWCWIGWESIGNSNWFVFDIIALYLLTYLSLSIANRLRLDLKKCALMVFFLTLAFDMSLNVSGKESYWYDTVLAYPVGMLYSLYKSQIEKAAKGYRWIACFLACVAMFILCREISLSDMLKINGITRMVNHLLFISASSFFALALTFLTMKLKFDNAVLRWLGVNAFAIYILQRLSMIICTHYGMNENSLVFSAIVIPSTLLIAAVFTATTNRMNKFLFRK